MPDVPPPTPEDLCLDLAEPYCQTLQRTQYPYDLLRAAIRLALHAEAENERLRDVLRAVEWGGRDDDEAHCPCCGNRQKYGHAPDCALAAALKETP